MKKLTLLFFFLIYFSIFTYSQEGNVFTETNEIQITSENRDFERVTKSYLILDLKEEKVEKNGIQIYDASGEYIMHQKPKGNLTRVDVSHLASGTYFLHIKTDTGLIVKQITIKRDGRENNIIIK